MNCSVSDDYFCGQITCSALFSHVDIDLTMEITRVDDSDWPRMYISAYISLSVRDNLTWSHSFLDGEKFKVPGFPLKVEGFEGADVFLQVSLNKENRTIYFKVSMIEYKVGFLCVRNFSSGARNIWSWKRYVDPFPTPREHNFFSPDAHPNGHYFYSPPILLLNNRNLQSFEWKRVKRPFFEPGKLENHTNEGKGKEKIIERDGRKEEKRKQQWLHT